MVRATHHTAFGYFGLSVLKGSVAGSRRQRLLSS
jgi:hypothetical protein